MSKIPYLAEFQYPRKISPKGEVLIFACDKEEAREKYNFCAKRHPEYIFLEDPEIEPAWFNKYFIEDDVMSSLNDILELCQYGAVPL